MKRKKKKNEIKEINLLYFNFNNLLNLLFYLKIIFLFSK
jgi:hypothetical protein